MTNTALMKVFTLSKLKYMCMLIDALYAMAFKHTNTCVFDSQVNPAKT